MNKKMMMHVSWIFSGLLLVGVGTAVGQDYPKVELSPDFSYTHTGAGALDQAWNCVGWGATAQYNVTHLLGIAADVSGCRAVGLSNELGVGSKVNASEFVYVFGPRLTLRKLWILHPFAELNFGGIRQGLHCNTGNVGNACGGLSATNLPAGGVVLPPGVTIITPPNPLSSGGSQNAFAMTVGGGFDIKLSHHIALRLVQAEYMYTHFGNACQFAYCNNGNSQNSFRLKSGLVFGFGGQ